jgi:imidazolonepropionase-like amidohydrolase
MISGGQVLPGPAGTRISDGAVLIDGDTITAVGPRSEIEALVSPEVVRRDYPGHTVLPGLINTHVHLAFDTSRTPVANLTDVDDLTLLLGMAGRAQQALAAGVTTIRDLGDRGGLAIRLREAIRRRELLGPRILSSAAPITIPEGHCWFLGGEAGDDNAIRDQVRHNIARGADVIKVMASGGQMTASSPPMWASQFSSDQLHLIVTEATAAGLPVAAHAHGTEAIAAAVAAGASTIEHCSFMGADGGVDERDDVAQRMAVDGIYACPAFPSDWRGFIELIGPERAERILGRFGWLDEHGVPLMPGTDSGLPGSMFGDYAGALGLYDYLSFPPERIIDMATTTAATGIGIGDHVGQLAPGYAADLLVVDGDPLTRFEDLRRQRVILAAGQDIKPEHCKPREGEQRAQAYSLPAHHY